MKNETRLVCLHLQHVVGIVQFFLVDRHGVAEVRSDTATVIDPNIYTNGIHGLIQGRFCSLKSFKLRWAINNLKNRIFISFLNFNDTYINQCGS